MRAVTTRDALAHLKHCSSRQSCVSYWAECSISYGQLSIAMIMWIAQAATPTTLLNATMATITTVVTIPTAIAAPTMTAFPNPTTGGDAMDI